MLGTETEATEPPIPDKPPTCACGFLMRAVWDTTNGQRRVAGWRCPVRHIVPPEVLKLNLDIKRIEALSAHIAGWRETAETASDPEDRQRFAAMAEDAERELDRLETETGFQRTTPQKPPPAVEMVAAPMVEPPAPHVEASMHSVVRRGSVAFGGLSDEAVNSLLEIAARG